MDVQAYLYPKTFEPKQALTKTAIGATVTALLIWLTNKPVFIPTLIAIGGIKILPLSTDPQHVSSPEVDSNEMNLETPSRDSAKAKRIDEAKAHHALLRSRTLYPLFVGAHFASLLCGSYYAFKAAQLASSLFPRLALPVYYSLPVLVNSWMLIALSRQIYEDNHLLNEGIKP